MTSTSAKITLTYPLYACDFDPQDANRLIVGGGGGAGRSGVGNKITFLDTSAPEEITTSAEIELSRDEDNVTSLAVGPRKGKATLVFAGVNSSPADQKKGNNQHFRVFGVDQPSRSKAAAGTGPKISEMSRSSLFASNKDADAYQRVLRLSAPFPGSPQVGAAATGLAKQSQIAVFDVPTTAGSGSSPLPKLRGRLDLEEEAADVDVIQTSDDPPSYRLVYCHDYEIHSARIAKGLSEADAAPRRIYTTPHDVATGAPRPTFRAMRFLTPGFLIAAGNLPKRSGVVLQGFRLPTTTTSGDSSKSETLPARLSISAKLPKHVPQTTAMAAVNLHPPSSPGAGAGDTQFVIAVAGIDCSITLYTLEHQTVAGVELLSKLHPFTTIRDVHPHPISSLVFSRFQPPGPPSSSSSSTLATASSPSKSSKKSAAATGTTSTTTRSTGGRPPVLKLASTSVANTAAVHTIPLKKHPSSSLTDANKSSSSKGRRPGPPRPRQPARYVVAASSRGPSPRGMLVALTVGVALLAALLQAFLEIKGMTPTPILGAARLAPASWVVPRREGLGVPLLVRLGGSETPYVLREGGSDGKGGLRIAPHVVAAGGSEDGERTGGGAVPGEGEGDEKAPVKWEELPAQQKKAWKERLKAAGHWGEEMGESIFKGILFGELGGAVGDFVRG